MAYTWKSETTCSVFFLYEGPGDLTQVSALVVSTLTCQAKSLILKLTELWLFLQACPDPDRVES